MKRETTPKVALFVSLTLKGGRSTVRGILDYAAKHGPWFCLFMEGRPKEQFLELAKDRDIAGVIVTGLTRLGVRDIKAFKAPVVFVEPWPEMIAPDFPLRNVPWVGRDSYAIGVMAANYYLQRGYKSFAFVGEPYGKYWSAERRRGFEETLAKDGFGCAAHDRFTEREKRSWPAERMKLVRFLGGLPKPTAVFAPMDGRARLVLEACLTAGIKVPEEIAVLGVDNDTLLCESTVPTLSSIHTGGFRRGRIAAEMLDDLMHGREPRELCVSLPPKTVVTRGSTGYDAMKDPVIAKAVSFIRNRARSGGVGVEDIVRAAGCSRRYLERHFRERLGRSVRDELVRERIENVKALLQDSDLTIGEITEATGFARDSHLAFLFRKVTGKTMLQWRRENREAQDE
ncbi:MAG: DNA-binding transcriptional regulator [Kiritimatiellae bacterium]|nr:DNA-binding transcriptional regulator [Kiritimatiellia bacterium]